MSGDTPATPPIRQPGAERDTLTVPEVIALAVPLCFVVEPDPLWGDRAVDALLEEHAWRASSDAHDRERVVARWTRTRRWSSYTPYAFGLGGGEGAQGESDVLEEVSRLTDHLESARPGDSHHRSFRGALFAMRGLQADLARVHAPDVLLDAVRQLSSCRATLLVEVNAAPAVESPVAGLGPIAVLSADPLLRYENAVSELAGMLRDPNAIPPVRELAGSLCGLSRLQAELVARMVGAAPGPSVLADLLQRVATARTRAEAVMSAPRG